ncbi:MAG: ATP-dependent sacrificial sulfur transferase LarE [Planctomycetota bacterium]
MNDALHPKLDRMRNILRALGRVVVAYSGGVDSVFVLKVAVDTLGVRNVLAVTSRSPSVPDADLEQARTLADSFGVEHVLIDPGEFENSDYLANPTNRCYICKSALYAEIEDIRCRRDFDAIVSGTNADDLGDYRPGLRAAKEHGVREPCVEAGLTKHDIRVLSAEMGLPTSDKPASPCLSSRVPYGQAITPEKMRMIDQAETFLRNLMASLAQELATQKPPAHRAGSCRAGVRREEQNPPTPGETCSVPVDCRVRHHGELARIEVPQEWIEILAKPENCSRIEAEFRTIGFRYVSLDLRGFRSGSLNEGVV